MESSSQPDAPSSGSAIAVLSGRSKLSAGILLLAFGTFWLGEGLGFNWFIEDWALLVLIGVYSVIAALTIRLLQTK